MYFKNDEDIVWFSTTEEFEDKVTFYLKHEDERKKIAARGMQKNKRTAYYMHRFDAMSDAVPGL